MLGGEVVSLRFLCYFHYYHHHYFHLDDAVVVVVVGDVDVDDGKSFVHEWEEEEVSFDSIRVMKKTKDLAYSDQVLQLQLPILNLNPILQIQIQIQISSYFQR